MGGSGVGYVWQKDQLTQLGRQIKRRELHLAESKEQNEKLKNQLETMHSPRFLEARIKELNLGLAQPVPALVWRLAEPATPAVQPAAEREYAAQDGLTSNAP